MDSVGFEVIKAIVFLAAPLLVVWAVFNLRYGIRFFWLPWIPGVPYIVSLVAVLTGTRLGGNVWIGTEFLLLPFFTIVIWISAVTSFLFLPVICSQKQRKYTNTPSPKGRGIGNGEAKKG
ncbi:MAG: hypothetical protein FWG52_07625 [Proteobacteria bacterium]|nr:hypothetical protein [Pseudomonadota bacterium]